MVFTTNDGYNVKMREGVGSLLVIIHDECG